MLRRAALALALLAAVPAAAQQTISGLPQIQGSPDQGDLVVIEHMRAPLGQRTSTVSVANLGLSIFTAYGIVVPTPTQFMGVLPTTMPSTVGTAWNNGGMLSVVQP